MQNKQRGRWVVHVAWLIGVGAAVIGGPIAVHAANGLPAVGGVSSRLGLLAKTVDSVHAPDDLIWN